MISMRRRPAIAGDADEYTDTITYPESFTAGAAEAFRELWVLCADYLALFGAIL